ncbi:S66 peptidase family protein [Natronoglycomyces albus]|uniref:LD-carboxypeptidase n=1 Tax=Natronoglycomyces albus TaxID=2811108 RepID=A0A895XIX3_9ACTN|nr:LD-carboxypeptidase [Natronoglycomyces albus]QSB04907.1 LD-carboxypeptidase [Natronoglycomyces albus]
MTSLRRPRRLVAGDRVAIISPSGPFPPDKLQAGLDVMRSWGLEPVLLDHTLDTHPQFSYLAGTDADRGRDFQAAWSDPTFAAVISARGGYGTQRMLEHVDWQALRQLEPKAYVGFSDATPLHEAINVRLGVATIHGPMPAWTVFIEDGETQEHLRQTLFEPESVQKIAPTTARTLVPGRATGVTFGGCVSLLSSGIGTPETRARAEGGILIIEDLEEEDYRLDRILTQLRRTGWLDNLAGVVAGSWTDCRPSYEQIRAVLIDRLGDYNVPIVEEFRFGHCRPSWTIPLGVSATLDADAGTLVLDVPALT